MELLYQYKMYPQQLSACIKCSGVPLSSIRIFVHGASSFRMLQSMLMACLQAPLVLQNQISIDLRLVTFAMSAHSFEEISDSGCGHLKGNKSFGKEIIELWIIVIKSFNVVLSSLWWCISSCVDVCGFRFSICENADRLQLMNDWPDWMTRSTSSYL